MKIWLPLILLCCTVPCYAQMPVHYNYSSSNGLPSNEVYKVQADKQGYLWFATDRGVSRFDGSRFITYSVNDGIGTNVVNDIIIAPNGDLWVVGDAKKLYRYNGKGFEAYSYNHLLEQFTSTSTIPPLASVAFENNQPAWFSIRSKGLLHITPNGQLQYDTTNQALNTLQYNTQLQMGAFYRPRWFSQSVKQKPQHHYFECNGRQYPFLQSDALNYLVRKNGTILLSLGYLLLEIRNQQVTNTYTYPNFITTLYEDNQQQLWVTAYGSGAHQYPPQAFPQSNNQTIYFNDTRISSVAQDREGGYWFCSYERGVFYVPRLNVVTLESNLLQTDEFFQELAFTGHTLYAATSQNRIFKAVPPAPLQPVFGDPSLKITNNCNDLVYDSVHQYLYACYSRLLYRLDLRNNSVTRYPPSSRSVLLRDNGFHALGPQSLMTDIATERVINIPSNAFCVFPKPNGDIWIGTEAGLYTIANNSVTQLYPAAINKRVTSIKSLPNGWIVGSTLGAGLALLKDNEVLPIKLGSSNAINMVNDIAIDGNIVWAATEAGIVRADLSHPTNPLISIIEADTRFPYNNTRKIAYYNHQLVVLAQNKLILLPTNNNLPNPAPPVWLQQIVVNDSLRLQPIQNHRFGFSSNRLRFLFNGICFSCGTNIRYRYRLIGLHNEWYTTAQPYVEYASLPPGTYTFEVAAVNNSNVPSTQAAVYYFTIPRPFWQQYWFWALALLLTLLLVGWLINSRLKRIQRRNREKELLLAREQVALSAQINPHFIFNSLNSIQHLIIQEDRQHAVLHMAQFSRLMRLSLDNSRKKWVAIQEEATLLELYLQLESLRFKDKFVYHLQIADNLLNSNLRIPAMLLQPFVENAVHHGINNLPGKNGQITISLQQEGAELLARIEDNGIGREKAARLKSAERGHLSAGMQITKERLQLLCRETNTPWSFTVTDKKDAAGEASGTLVTFNMPFIKTANNNEIP